MPEPSNFEAIKQRVLAEYDAQVNSRTVLSFKETMELREYAKSRTDLIAEQLTAEQTVWKALYVSLTEEARRAAPDLLAEIEVLEKKQKDLLYVLTMMAAKRKANPHDYGVRVWWGFVIVGLLIGWMDSPKVGSILSFGVTFWLGGMLFCVFALDSPEVQGNIALFLYHKLNMKRTALWLYNRAITIHARP